MWGSPLPFTVWILICLVGPNDKQQQNSSLSLVHELRSSYDEAPLMPIMCAEILGDPTSRRVQHMKTLRNYLFYANNRNVTLLQFLTPLHFSFPKPTFHSSSWQLVHCIRRPTRTWIIFLDICSHIWICWEQSSYSTIIGKDLPCTATKH